MAPKFLVCTMHCGELDFPHHVQALAQQGVEYEHRVFKDMVEVDAHNAVYQAFNGAGPDWIRLKLDADVVLYPGALLALAKNVGSHSWIDPMVDDYFTNGPLHAGAACYGPSVRFRHQHLTLKCDRDVCTNGALQHHGVIGKHAHYADEWTAFRYGLHRGMKGQTKIMDAVQRAWEQHRDPVRFAALRGFDVAMSDIYWDYGHGHEPPPMDHNYGNPRLLELFELYKDGRVVPPKGTRR